MKDYISDIREIMWSGIRAVQPARVLPAQWQLQGDRLMIAGHQVQRHTGSKLLVIAMGKAAAAMAVEAEKIVGDQPYAGLCVTKYGHALPLHQFEVIEAAHPVPDENSIQAGSKLMQMIAGLKETDVVILLISGGASSLVADLPDKITLEDLQQCFDLLVTSGAGIQEMNVVRKHLSGLKGGQLAKKAHPANVYSLIISDVVGDDLSSIASGPAAPDNSSFADAKSILEKHHCWHQLPISIQQHIEKGIQGLAEETIQPGNPVFKKVHNFIIANNETALEAAKQKAEGLGFHTAIVEKNMNGDTVETARKFSRKLVGYRGPVPACFLMGGETNLKVTGNGKGGRNQHFVLSAADELSTKMFLDKRIIILSAGTDGTDGPTDATGAYIDSDMLFSQKWNNAEMEKALSCFNSYPFFEKLGTIVKTGPTQTNVMDIIIGIVTEKE